MNRILDFLIRELNHDPQLSEISVYGDVYFPYDSLKQLFNGITLYATKKCFRTNKMNMYSPTDISIEDTKRGSEILECIEVIENYTDTISYNESREEDLEIIWYTSYAYHMLMDHLAFVNDFWYDYDIKATVARVITNSLIDFVEEEPNKIMEILLDKNWYYE